MTDQWNTPAAIRWLERLTLSVVPIGEPFISFKDDHYGCRCDITGGFYSDALANSENYHPSWWQQ